jgi:hypothetical protein
MLILLKSRKFWALVVGLGVLVGTAFDLQPIVPEEQMTEFIALLVAYILGTGIEDARKV